MEIEDARGKCQTFDLDQPKAWRPREYFRCLGDFRQLDTGGGCRHDGYPIPLHHLVGMHMSTDHPTDGGIHLEQPHQLLAIVQRHGIDPGQTKRPGMVMHKHQGWLVSIRLQVLTQPRELGRIEVASGRPGLQRIKGHKVVPLVVEAVVVWRTRR